MGENLLIESNQHLFSTMAATLRVQHGPGWTATALMAMGNQENWIFLINLPIEGSENFSKEKQPKI